MDSKFTLAISNNNQEWDQFQDASVHGCVYQYSNYIDSLNISNDKIFLKKNNITLAAAIIFKNNNSVRIPYSLYQGISIVNDANLKEQQVTSRNFKITTDFLELLIKEYNNFKFCLSPYFEDIRPFLWLNYHDEKASKFKIDLRYTGLIDLKKYENFDNYFQSIRSVRKRVFIKHDEKNLRIEETKDVQTFINLYKKTFDRQNIDISDLSLVESIINSAINNSYGTLSICYDAENNPHSGIVILYDKNTAYYAFGATDPDYRSSGASVILMVNCIRKAFDMNLKSFDMCGVNSPNRGDFKLSFNARLLSYFEVSFNNE